MALSAAPAMAETSTVYDNFTRCPTSSPAMNDSSATGVVCASSLVREGLIKVGNFQAPITSPLHIQFAMVFEEEVVTVVPGSTSVESAPFLVPNPFYKPPAATVANANTNGAQSPQVVTGQGTKKAKKRAGKHKKKGKKHKKHHKKKQHKKKTHQKKKQHKKKTHQKKKNKKKPVTVPPVSAPASPPAATPPAAESAPFVKASVEAIGDIDKINLAVVFGGEGSPFRTATRIHLEGPGLGPSCYIGSVAEPIYLEPEIVSPPTSGGLAVDPNGFPVEILTIGGMTSEDTKFTVPGASGCGQEGSLNTQINALLGLPASPGGAKVVFGNVHVEMAATEFDGTAPDGGVQLQEAFDAAK
jgi:hypothetical protein